MIDKIFTSNGILAQHLKGYEPRPGQSEMAEAVHNILTSNTDIKVEFDQADCLVAEAETGLGKTLAYLIPAALSGRKVIISTNTRNLQDQILDREIPFIQNYILPDLKAMCIKGRQNYLCLNRWHQTHTEKQSSLFREKGDKDLINEWIDNTNYGDRSELSWLKSASPLWQKICCQSQTCSGSECPEKARCFLNRLRKDAAACNLLIVNHHLLFSDLAVRKTGYGEVLPRYEAVVFDEAHHVENVATTFFGHSFSKYQVNDLVGDMLRSTSVLTEKEKKTTSALATALTADTEALGILFPMEKGRFPLDQFISQKPAVEVATAKVSDSLNRLAEMAEKLPSNGEPWDHYANRCYELDSRLTLITADLFNESIDNETHYTYWFERTDRNLTLNATPIDVSQELKDTLFSATAACVFTSATLRTGSSFTYFLKRLGLSEDTQTFCFPSPFDYANRTLLYIPKNSFPEPASPAYQQQAQDQIKLLVQASQGRALILFTSFRAMESAFEYLKDTCPYPMLMQGDAPRHVLLQRFFDDSDSVLFGVSSFWEGVDVPGNSLSLLIIDKLPFEVPSDPVIMARINKIKANGGNPFFDFQVPRAILSLRQGVGRLMRTTKDKGVIAILDIRLYSKGYGRRFLKSLPPSPITRTPEQVTDFFRKNLDNE